MAVPASTSRVGHVVGGRYKILSVLGQGGMGVLYTAEHLMTKRRVALKVVRVDPDRQNSLLGDAAARFLAEARHAAAVSHPNIVDVLDMGLDDDGAPFLVMELLTGTTLDRYLAERGRMPVAEVLSLLLPVLGALATLHDAGIVHRDVKTSNIFLRTTARGGFEAKLLDFGLAHSANDARITRSGFVMGTPLYMAPEQGAGSEVGPGADVWSLGVVLFECLSGALPFTARDRNGLAAQVLAGQVQSLAKVAPEVPTPIVYAVERALRIDLSLRYRSARELAQGLVLAASACQAELPLDPDPIGLTDYQRWRQGRAGEPSTQTVPHALRHAPPSEAAPARAPAGTPATPSPASRPPAPRGSRRALWVALALLLATGAGYALLDSQPGAAAPREASSGALEEAPSVRTPPAPAATSKTATVAVPDASTALDTTRPVAPTLSTSEPAPAAAPRRTSAATRRSPTRAPRPAAPAAEPSRPSAPPDEALRMESDWR